MKLNELVCPTCGLKCLTDEVYTTCASCNTCYYASQSRSVDNPTPVQLAPVQITPWPVAPLNPQPLAPQWPITWPYITWIGDVPPHDAVTIVSTEDVGYQVFN